MLPRHISGLPVVDDTCTLIGHYFGRDPVAVNCVAIKCHVQAIDVKRKIENALRRPLEGKVSRIRVTR